MINLVFDDIVFCLGQSGIAKYWENILKIWKTTSEESGVKIIILNRSDFFTNFGFENVPFPATWLDDKYTALDRELVQKVCTTINADVYVPSFYRFVIDVPTFQIVHELTPEVMNFGLSDRFWLESQLSLLVSDSFMAVSGSAKKNFKSFYPNSNLISDEIAYPAVDTTIYYPRNSVEVENLKMSLGINKKYILVHRAGFGANENENDDIVFRALSKDYFRDFEFVFVGGESFRDDELEIARLAKVKITRVALDETELAVAYSGAEVTINLSLYESFGLPALESIACGTPVITSSGFSELEASGDLAIHFDCNSVQDLREMFKKATHPQSRTLIKDNIENHLSKFDWENTAKLILDEIIQCARQGVKRSSEIQRILNEYSSLAKIYQS